jgi:carboxylesterase
MKWKIIILLAVTAGCAKKDVMPPIDDLKDLDGTIIVDSSLVDPASFLLSAALPSPSAADLQKQVIITVHGFSASNFEWQEFAGNMKDRANVLVSRVLMGGHGRDYRAFRTASWHDWQAPVIEEYEKLAAKGFTKISLIGASTGCPVILDMLSTGKINTALLNKIFFVDPIIIPADKNLSLAPLVGGSVIDYTETELSDAENGYWYKYRPAEALKELNELTISIRKKLEDGLTLPPGVGLYVYKSESDQSADPVSAVLIQKGIEGANVELVRSQLHVFTRLKGRSYTPADTELQQTVFNKIYSAL